MIGRSQRVSSMTSERHGLPRFWSEPKTPSMYRHERIQQEDSMSFVIMNSLTATGVTRGGTKAAHHARRSTSHSLFNTERPIFQWWLRVRLIL